MKTLVKEPPKTTKIIRPRKQQTIKYDSTWLNEELNKQIALLNANQQIWTKIQLFQLLPYTISKWKYWKKQIGQRPRTDELQQKINEILEARLVTQGFTQKNYAYIIFLLKNNYGYTDTRTVEQETTHTFKVERGVSARRPRKVIDLTPVKS